MSYTVSDEHSRYLVGNNILKLNESADISELFSMYCVRAARVSLHLRHNEW